MENLIPWLQLKKKTKQKKKKKTEDGLKLKEFWPVVVQ